MTTKQKQQQEKASNVSAPSAPCVYALAPSSSFPTCLQQLCLTDVKHTEMLPTLSNLTSLTELTVLSIPDFFAGSHPSWPHEREVFSRSSKLLQLWTSYNTGFLAAPICSLFSSTLTRLYLWFDDEVERLTKEQEEALQLLISLQELRFASGDKLQRLPAGLHKLTNLEKLGILSCSSIRSLPSLPSSLRELEINNCKAIKSLPNSLPSALKKLKISECKAIKSLPKGGLPSSMRELDVCHWDNSEELKRVCCKLIGSIPIIRA